MLAVSFQEIKCEKSKQTSKIDRNVGKYLNCSNINFVNSSGLGDISEWH